MRRYVGYSVGLMLAALLAPPVALADSSFSNTGPIVRFATTLGDIDVQLLTAQAPNTVTNFLDYANGTNGPTYGSYSGTFFHRSVPGFVVQGGGYAYAGGEPQAIAAGPAIKSEAGVANTAGTLAMALSTGPDSATDEWFFNLTNNPQLNDTSDGGPFTVFGEVLDSAGMNVMNQIAAAQVDDASSQWGSAFTDVPVVNFSGNPLVADNLIYVNSIDVLPSVAPTISISTPSSGQVFTQGQNVPSVFSCSEPTTGTGVATCSGPATVATRQAGTHTFTVTAIDNAGNITTQDVSYVVDALPTQTTTTPTTTTSTTSQPPPPRALAPSLSGTPATTARGAVTARLHCGGSSRCIGIARLTVSGLRNPVASVKYSIPARGTGTVHFTLNAAGRQLLKRDRGRLAVTLTILPTGPRAVTTVRRITLAVKRSGSRSGT
jgi:cyclophilin family peptidyl-prolyl cis-trans isomerase